MKLPFDKKYLGIGLTMFAVTAAGILFYFILRNFSVVTGFVSMILDILAPIIWGLVIAYILSPILNFFENKCFSPLIGRIDRIKNPKKIVRALSMFATLLTALGLLTALIWLVIPQLVSSIITMCGKVPEYLRTIEQFLDGLFKENQQLLKAVNLIINQMNLTVEKVVPQVVSFTSNMMPKIGEIAGNMAMGAIGVVNGVINLFVGIVVSIYVMFSKETFASQIKRVFYALFPAKFVRRFFDAVHTTDRTFGGFISGKLLDSAIIGVLCFVFCAIVHMPYAPLVSVLIGVTNIIPFFGPFIGAVPSAFIILLESPLMALVFVIFIIILQQIDGNIIGPKILGDSTGLSAFWVIFAILLGGGLWGFVGMFIGVPTFAVIYIFVTTAVKNRLKAKKMPVDPEMYSGSADEIEKNIARSSYNGDND